MTLAVDNNQWSIIRLYEKRNSIIKPQFQRDKGWTIQPNKNGKPNYRDYINFLFKTKNSVDPISFGIEIYNSEEVLINIDGNNRINAIFTFLERPYLVFPEYFSQINDFIKQISNLDNNEKISLISFINKLSYRLLSTFRRFDRLVNKDNELIMNIQSKCNGNIIGTIEDYLTSIQDKLRINDTNTFDENVILNINLFKNANLITYSEIFKDINKHSNPLSANELLSSVLYTNRINLSNLELSLKLKKIVKKYYDYRGSDEVLKTFKIENIETYEMSAYDFMISFQEYCYELYPSIEPFFDNKLKSNSSILSLFFKIYNTLFGLNMADFTNTNIEKFIEIMLKACEIYHKTCLSIFPENVNNTIFNSESVKISSLLKTNNKFVILTSIISNLEEMDDKMICKKLKPVIVFHLFRKFLAKDILATEKAKFEGNDSISYIAGGAFIDNLCNDIYRKKKQTHIFDLVNKDIMNELFDKVISSSINESYRPKRKKLSLIHKILLCNFYNNNTPNKFLNEKYSLEHIIPFSSQNKDNDVDIDRIGNLYPLIDELNKKRGNKIINYRNEESCSFLQKLIPSQDEYNKIIDEKGPVIKNVSKYNSMCCKNESIYKECLLNDLFE